LGGDAHVRARSLLHRRPYGPECSGDIAVSNVIQSVSAFVVTDAGAQRSFDTVLEKGIASSRAHR